jgi:hypothetical protein
MQNRSNILARFVTVTNQFIKAAILLFLISGCTGTKFLKEGETFYAGSEIKLKPQGKIAGKKQLREELQDLIPLEPNRVILGMRPGVWFYYAADNPKKKKGFRNYIKKKLGREPVLLRDATPGETSKSLEIHTNNEGYFKSVVNFEVKTKRKKSKVIYTVTLEKPYHIKNVNYIFFDSLHAATISEIQKSSLIKENSRYSLEMLSAEQERIEELAENKGFYYFDDRYLLFKADTTIGEKMVELDLTVEPGVPERAKKVYYVNDISVFPNYSLSNDSLAITGDTIMVDGFRYIDNQHNFRPRVLTNVINMKPDSMYRRVNHEYTLSHLMGLNTFKFVNIKYRGNRRDSTSLRAFIYLTPLPKKSFRLQVQGVSKSNNFVGPGVEFTFSNRNFLRGAEMFQLKLNGSYEMQVRTKQTTLLNALELGGEASLSFPRFITPFRIQYHSSKYLPQTKFKVGYTFQDRLQYFRLNSFNVSGGYTWRETMLKTHELFPVDITFVQTGNTSAEFDQLLEENPVLDNSFQNQFILGSRYSFTFNTQLNDQVEQKYGLKKKSKSDFYFRGTLDLSGNLAHALQSIKSTEEEEPYNFFNAPYSQFVRTDLDFRYYLKLNKFSKIATRVATGIGYALGNSETMPYIKQYSVGGSISLRAFPARSVGPGTYNIFEYDSITFIDQRGDIKLESSVEYRFDIVNSLKGALFIDAGNIWLVKEDSLRPGGKFDKTKFLKELAVGTGFGLRFDFNFFVLRFDLAFPLRKAYREPGNRWVLDEINFGSRDWRRENLILNIAIGYPF